MLHWSRSGKRWEHYEIASYGCSHEWAKLLQNEEATRIIEEILKQERNCDETLQRLAVESNQEALNADSKSHDNKVAIKKNPWTVRKKRKTS
jgi:ferritin-like metal-binding protein YciE